VSAQSPHRSRIQASAARKLLEAGFPYADVSAVARADRFIPDVLYSAHKWWARRPPSVIRALLLGSVLSPDTTREAFWELYSTDLPLLDGLHVGDPFMGGATTLVEAARLGASVTGTDIDPLAVLIAREELSSPDESGHTAGTAQRFLDYMHESCGDLYEAPTTGGTPLHYFWLRKVTCLVCHTEALMYRTPVLARDVGKKGAVVRERGIEAFCPRCRKLHHVEEDRESFICCGLVHRLDIGTYINATYACSGCGTRSKHAELKTNKLPRVLIAIEESTPKGRRRFRSPNAEDYACLEKATVLAETVSERVPTASLADVDFGRPELYGVETVADLFSSRQQAIFATAFAWIQDISGSEDIRRRLRLGVSNALSTNNMLCGYATDYGRLAPLFAGVRSYAMPVLSVELNPLHPHGGRGNLDAMSLTCNQAALQSGLLGAEDIFQRLI
jgi:putative DNA methylase